MYFRPHHLFLAFVPFLLSACSALVGLKKQRKLSISEIDRYAAKYHIPLNESYELDTRAYHTFIRGIMKPGLKKDLQQPLQVRVYDSGGTLQFGLVNCYIGGFPNLNWNAKGVFDSFPPTRGPFRSLDTVLTLQQDVKYYINLWAEPIYEKQPRDLYIVVFWSHFMGRQSKRLIRLINEYQKKFTDKRITVLFVNDDNYY